MLSENKVHVREFTKSELARVNIISGVSPKVLRRVFSGWLFFIMVVALVVIGAPQLSATFVGMTISVLLLFTFVIFGQSRISEGWPAIILDQQCVGFVQDPHLRQFIMVPCHLITDAVATKTAQQRKVVEVYLDTRQLGGDEIDVLNTGLWPHRDRVVGMVQYRTRASVVQAIKKLCPSMPERMVTAEA